MSTSFRSPARVGAFLCLACWLLVGCQDQQPEPIAPQLAKVKPNRTLTVTGAGTGYGAVTAPQYGETSALTCEIGAGTNDPAQCSRTYGWKTSVELTATPQPGSTFAGWTGACSGTALTCRVVMTQSREVRANFSGTSTPSFALNVSATGTGSGTVRSQTGLSPAINCTINSGTASSSGCSASYLQGTVVTLSVTLATDNTFNGWSGHCSGSSCTLTMAGNRTVTASLSEPPGPEVTYGRWDAAQSTTVLGMHLAQLPNGKAIMWGHLDEPHLWNGPGAGSVAIPNTTCDNLPSCELFCAGHAWLPDGKLLVAGGHNEELGDLHGITQASIFDGSTWQRTGYMTHPRWYPTLVTLANGDVLAISGTKAPDVYARIPERYSGGTWTQLTGINIHIPFYPRAFVEPKAGNVFIVDGSVHNLNPNGAGSTSTGVGPLQPDRSYGTAVMLDSKVLHIGGGGESGCPANLPRNTTELIDLAATTPAWAPSGSMSVGRRHLNATILPDGTVLVTGGSSLCGFSNESGAVFLAELWNPQTGQFSQLANSSVVRVYHSTTMLLADGRVMSSGSGEGSGVVRQLSYEIFSPPYLFKGPRPTYTLAGGMNLRYGQSFTVTTSAASSIRKVTMIRLASTTHAFDMGQRLNTLAFQVGADGQSLVITAPAEGKIAPPGPYRLFLVNDQGVPSVGQTILLAQ